MQVTLKRDDLIGRPASICFCDGDLRLAHRLALFRFSYSLVGLAVATFASRALFSTQPVARFRLVLGHPCTPHTPTRPHLYFGHLFRVNTSLWAVTPPRMMCIVRLFTLHTSTHIRYTLVVLPCVSSWFLIIGVSSARPQMQIRSGSIPLQGFSNARPFYCL